LLDAIRSLSARQQSIDESDSAIDLRSIHRAKGREWPVVVLPGCVDGTLPLSSDGQTPPSTEEERRLLYVALTRAQDHLLISSPADERRSPFLADASIEPLLQSAKNVQAVLTSAPDALSEEDLIRLCQNITTLNLTSYIKSWWTPSEAHRTGLKKRLDTLFPTIATALRRHQAYRQRRAESMSAHQATVEQTRDRLRSHRDDIGTAPITATHDASAPSLPSDAVLTFSWNDPNSELSLLWNETQVGTLQPLNRHRLDSQTVLTLPWSLLVGRVDRVRPRQQTLRFRIDWTDSIQHVDARIEEPKVSLSPPSDRTQALCSDEFRAGYDSLREALCSQSSSDKLQQCES
jgi:DNA helicase-2/ATP-dependent DNA helicase PcrA